MIRMIVAAVVALMPWPIKRALMRWLYGYKLDATARIGLSLVTCQHLEMGLNSRIGSLDVIKGAELVQLGQYARIGNLNWVSGAARRSGEQGSRRSALIVNDHAAITHRHMLDCYDCITLGAYTTFAGFRSQILTHSIDINSSLQTSAPVTIGDYCFVGTNAVLLKGSSLPSFSVLGAGAVLSKAYEEQYGLYGGVPARKVSELDPKSAYFSRRTGFVHTEDHKVAS